MNQVTVDTPEFKSFMLGLQRMIDDNAERMGDRIITRMEFKSSRKYIKIIRDYAGQHSSYGFIDKSNGNILKAASWSAPARHARGNIFDPDNGLGCCGPYSIAYL